MVRSWMKSKIGASLVLIAALALGGTLAGAALHQHAAPSRVFHGCLNVRSHQLTSLYLAPVHRCPVGSIAVVWNARGPRGVRGASGANGSSILTSARVPSGACVNGDNDLDLRSGEVYDCPGGSWVDLGGTCGRRRHLPIVARVDRGAGGCGATSRWSCCPWLP